MAKIKTYKDLYDYFREHKELFDVIERPRIPCIEVTRINKNGKRVIRIEQSHEPHEQLARYIFTKVEVTRPELTIGENALKAIIKNLLLDPAIFEYPP